MPYILVTILLPYGSFFFRAICKLVLRLFSRHSGLPHLLIGKKATSNSNLNFSLNFWEKEKSEPISEAKFIHGSWKPAWLEYCANEIFIPLKKVFYTKFIRYNTQRQKNSERDCIFKFLPPKPHHKSEFAKLCTRVAQCSTIVNNSSYVCAEKIVIFSRCCRLSQQNSSLSDEDP